MSATRAAWAAFFHGLSWPTTWAGRGWCAIGGAPLLARFLRAQSQAGLEAVLPGVERWAAGRGWRGDLLVVGHHPLPTVESYLACDPPAGLIGEFNRDFDEVEATHTGLTRRPPRWRWCPALWTRCHVCDRLGVYAETGSWTIRPCGHSEGDWHSGSDNLAAIGERWARALHTQQRRSYR